VGGCGGRGKCEGVSIVNPDMWKGSFDKRLSARSRLHGGIKAISRALFKVGLVCTVFCIIGE
jgi:hypothetical protein